MPYLKWTAGLCPFINVVKANIFSRNTTNQPCTLPECYSNPFPPLDVLFWISLPASFPIKRPTGPQEQSCWPPSPSMMHKEHRLFIGRNAKARAVVLQNVVGIGAVRLNFSIPKVLPPSHAAQLCWAHLANCTSAVDIPGQQNSMRWRAAMWGGEMLRYWDILEPNVEQPPHLHEQWNAGPVLHRCNAQHLGIKLSDSTCILGSRMSTYHHLCLQSTADMTLEAKTRPL